MQFKEQNMLYWNECVKQMLYFDKVTQYQSLTDSPVGPRRPNDQTSYGHLSKIEGTSDQKNHKSSLAIGHVIKKLQKHVDDPANAKSASRFSGCKVLIVSAQHNVKCLTVSTVSKGSEVRLKTRGENKNNELWIYDPPFIRHAADLSLCLELKLGSNDTVQRKTKLILGTKCSLIQKNQMWRFDGKHLVSEQDNNFHIHLYSSNIKNERVHMWDSPHSPNGHWNLVLALPTKNEPSNENSSSISSSSKVETADLLHLLNNPTALQSKVDEAMTVLCESKRISVQSAGFRKGKNRSWYSKFFLGSEAIPNAPSCRGFNCIRLDKEDLNIHDMQFFDTHMRQNAAKEMIEFVKKIPDGDIVLVSVNDEASKKITDGVYAALRSLGGGRNLKLGYRASYALIGQKGAPVGSMPEKWNNNGDIVKLHYDLETPDINNGVGKRQLIEIPAIGELLNILNSIEKEVTKKYKMTFFEDLTATRMPFHRFFEEHCQNATSISTRNPEDSNSKVKETRAASTSSKLNFSSKITKQDIYCTILEQCDEAESQRHNKSPLELLVDIENACTAKTGAKHFEDWHPDGMTFLTFLHHEKQRNSTVKKQLKIYL
jgi:hypothetical protein